MTAIDNALRTGGASAITVGIAYAACSVVFWLFPEAAAGFTKALFHGLDFRQLHGAPAGFSFGGFLYALGVLAVWAFVFGGLFGWINGRR